MRRLQFLTFVHRVHHIHYSYGWVFLPLMLGYFPDYRRRCGASALHFVRPKHFHNCTLDRRPRLVAHPDIRPFAHVGRARDDPALGNVREG